MEERRMRQAYRLYVVKLFCVNIIARFGVKKWAEQRSEKITERFALRCIHEGWWRLIAEQRKVFCSSYAFQQALLRNCDRSCMYDCLSEIFDELVEAKRLWDSRDLYLIAVLSRLRGCFWNTSKGIMLRQRIVKELSTDAIKIFYSRNDTGEYNQDIAKLLLEKFKGDREFIKECAVRGSCKSINDAFLEFADIADLKEFVHSQGLEKAGFPSSGEMPQKFFEVRSALQESDVAKFEHVLLQSSDVMSVCEIIERFGLLDESLRQMIKRNNSQIIASYNKYEK